MKENAAKTKARKNNKGWKKPTNSSDIYTSIYYY